MSDELALRTELARAGQAEELLKHPLLVEAFDVVEAFYIQAWKNSKLSESEGREKLWRVMQIIPLVKEHIQHVAANGAMAKHALKDFEKPRRFGIV